MYPEGSYVLLSEFQRQFFPDVPVAAVIPNGIATASFPFCPNPGSYLVYLGDFRPTKGPLEAIRCSRAAGIPLKLAGPESKYFHDVIKPELDGRNIEYVGEVDHDRKVALLSGALALIFPLYGLEACPTVLIESMACGTPIVAIGTGPVPEMVVQGVGGMVVNNPADIVGAIKELPQFDRRTVRRHAVECFDISRMVEEYLRLFETVAWRKYSEPSLSEGGSNQLRFTADLPLLATRYEKAVNSGEPQNSH